MNASLHLRDVRKPSRIIQIVHFFKIAIYKMTDNEFVLEDLILEPNSIE